ncbi:MAG: HEAT repeat domain-containing protein [Isosphaeraceae bacterium]|nr:HEAT repeat domain-containing protein [Isosphaeraceae bacterium]
MRTIASCLDLARTGHHEAALHGLMELGENALPGLVDAYRTEPNPAVRALIVEVVWQLRTHASIAFLDEAIQDPAAEVWQQALDGLVTLASAESLHVLESARDRIGEDREEFREWVDGAIEDVSGRLDE